MLSRYKAYMFDLDGTLVDSTGTWIEVMYRVLSESGLDISKEIVAELESKGLDPVEYLIRDPDLRRELWAKAHKLFLKNVSKLEIILSREDVLTIINGRPAAVVTSAHSRVAKKMLKHADLLDVFDVVISSDRVVNTKPHPEPVLKALDHIGEGHAVLIGDSWADEAAAAAAGVDFIHIRAVKRYVQSNRV